jgi:hypothetical protein
MFDKWRGSKVSKPKAIGATSAVVATTLVTAFAHPGTADARGLNINKNANVDNAGVTVSFTPEQMLQMRYGAVKPTTLIDLRSTALENTPIGVTNIIGNTVGIDSVAANPATSQETAPNGQPLAVPMETLTPAEQSDFDKTAADQGAKPADSFPEEGTHLSGIFRDYFLTHGGIAQQGYPITDVIWEERDDPNHPGQKMKLKVQYFERAIFEYHPENEAPNNVLLTLLGSQAFDADRFANTAPSPNPDQLTGFNQEQGSHTFPETGKTVSGRFLDYWNKNGGLAQQGLPRSNMIVERSPIDGNLYVMQYFERAVFEYHPEVNSEEYKVLLSLLGSGKFNERYVNGSSGGPIEDTPTPVPTAVPVATATPTETPTATPEGPTYHDYPNPDPEAPWVKGADIIGTTDTGKKADFLNNEAIHNIIEQALVGVSVNTGKPLDQVKAEFTSGNGIIDGVTQITASGEDPDHPGVPKLGATAPGLFGMQHIYIGQTNDWPAGAPHIQATKTGQYNTFWSDGKDLYILFDSKYGNTEDFITRMGGWIGNYELYFAWINYAKDDPHYVYDVAKKIPPFENRPVDISKLYQSSGGTVTYSVITSR